jgi:hypothetical protein
MSDDNVTPIRPSAPELPGPDQFDRIYDGMQAQLDTLCCVRAVLRDANIEDDEDLTAASLLLHRTFRELQRLHTELAEWHMAQSKVRP